MPADRTFHIRPVLDGQTLAAGLRILDAKLSWADARRLIHQRHIHLNGNLVLDETRRLATGDVVKVFHQPRAPVPKQNDVKVVYLDEDLIVIEKPPGITTLRHSEESEWDDRRKQRQPTLDEVVQLLLPEAWPRRSPRIERPVKSDGPPAAPAGIIRKKGGRPPPTSKGNNLPVPKVRPVHRLDRDTSGVMLFALSPQAETALIRMFKAHTIQRSYLAVVLGKIEASRRIESWLVRDRGDGVRGSTANGKPKGDAQRAVTHFDVIEAVGEQYTVIRCRLESGRTHQIRIHLAEAGHPLCGEKTYLKPRLGEKPLQDVSDAPRQALHSADLEFEHPLSGQAMKFSSPLPRDLAIWLGKLKV